MVNFLSIFYLDRWVFQTGIKLKTIKGLFTRNMGWYTNYEVEFEDCIDWNDNDVKFCLKPFNVDYLYLRDMDKPRIILCIYSQNPIENILNVLKSYYPVKMSYRIYNSGDAWIAFT